MTQTSCRLCEKPTTNKIADISACEECLAIIDKIVWETVEELAYTLAKSVRLGGIGGPEDYQEPAPEFQFKEMKEGV